VEEALKEENTGKGANSRHSALPSAEELLRRNYAEYPIIPIIPHLTL
jgi:hypothetical protein